MTPYFLFFFASGFCSLVYQVVWLRLAMAEFGVTTPIVSVTVSVFMAGLAAGSALGGALAGRLRARPGPGVPLRLYAGAEATIALSAHVVPWGLALGRSLMSAAQRDAEWSSGLSYVLSGSWITLVLLGFCIAMGTTFPLAMAAIRRDLPQRSARSFGFLYLANVLGAAAGSLLSAFVLIELLGFRGTLHMAAVLNALVAAGAMALSLRRTPAGAAEAPAPDAGEAQDRGAFLALFATGFASMGMEVAWVRCFAPLLGNVVYAFALILATYLLATAAGSAVHRRRGAEQAPVAWAWAATAAVSLLPLLASDARIVAGRLSLVPGLGQAALVALGVAPFCAALGWLTPLVVDRFAAGDPRRAGRAYAVNAIGCVLGPLAAGFLLLPALGERATLATLAIGLGVLTTALGPGRRGSRGPILASVACGALLLALTRDVTELYGPGSQVRRDATATSVARGEGMGKRLWVNGISMTYLTPITKMMAHLPLASLSHPPRAGLTICLGMGTSFRSLCAWGIDCTAVELVPGVIDLLPFFQPDMAALGERPGARLVADDGRRFLERTARRFDVIVVDPPPPFESAGSSLLYSREFYAAARRRLTPGGILQAWFPFPPGDAVGIAAALLALRDSFPYVRIFGSLEGWGLHALASDSPIPSRTPEELAARLPEAAARDLVAWGPHATAAEQFAAMPEQALAFEALRRIARPLEDDHPINEYFLVRQWRQRVNARQMGPS